MEDYLKVDAVNWSTLKHFFKSPAHVKAYMDTPPRDTKATTLGTLQHMALLEPEKLKDECIAAPDFGPLRKTDTTTSEEGKANKLAKLDFYEQNKGKNIIPAADYEKLIGMSQAVYANKECSTLLKSIEITEMPIFWDDNGVKCKGLVDMYSKKGIIIDLKTTEDCRYHIFQKKAVQYGYFGQATYYLRGAEKAGLKADHFIWIVVETVAPYAVQIFTLPDLAKIAFNNVIDAFLLRYSTCKQLDKWPPYSTEIQSLEVPEYHLTTLEGVL